MSVDVASRLCEQNANLKSPEELVSEKIYKCDETGCDKEFKGKRFLTLHQYNTHEHYTCDEPDCYATFAGRDRLETHKLVNHYGERPFKCNYAGCDKSYRKDAHLKRHKITSHFLENDTQETREVVCEIGDCGKMYSNKYSLNNHIARDHAGSVKLNAFKKQSDVEKRHICDEPGCTAAFYRPYRLKNHKLTVHGGERPFKCDFVNCDKSYSNESHLARHKSVSHYEEGTCTSKQVVCGMDGCGKIFSNKYSLRKHMSTCQTEFPFSCQECHQKFKRKSQLRAHEVEAHGKEAHYKCGNCPLVFVQYYLYKKHLRSHKVRQCDCDKTFKKWSELMKHRKTECKVGQKEHKCIICGKTFASKRTLSLHSLKVHIPESQVDLLKCPYLDCTRSYKYKPNLNHHIKTYHEKLFDTVKCPEQDCEMVFKSNKNLKQHLKIVHSGQPVKVSKPRKPRKDKGIIKKCMASLLSGVEENTVGKRDVNFKEKDLNTTFVPLDGSEEHKTVDVSSSNMNANEGLGICKSMIENEAKAEGKQVAKDDCQDILLDEEVGRVKCPEQDCEMVFKSNKNLKQHLKIVHSGQPVKVSKPRKPRKDKVIIKKCMASLFSGVEENIVGKRDVNFKEKDLNTIFVPSDAREEAVDASSNNMKQHEELGICESMIENEAKAEGEQAKNDKCQYIMLDDDDSSSFKSESSGVTKNSENTNEELNDQNKAQDSQEMSKKNNVLIIDMDITDKAVEDPIILQVPNLFSVGYQKSTETQNSEINNPSVEGCETDFKPKSVNNLQISINTEKFVFDKHTSQQNTGVPSEIEVLNLNTVTHAASSTSNQTNCESGVVIFDFPELENLSHSVDVETLADNVTLAE